MSTSEPLPTDFLPAERLEGELLAQALKRVEEQSWTLALIEQLPEAILVLDQHRQVVYANVATAELISVRDRRELLGLRPGELLNCRSASEAPAGCGTTLACRTCGLMRAVVLGLEGCRGEEECQLGTEDLADSLDLRVWSKPIRLGEEEFILVTL
jgi:PAS domain-containing protein